MEEYFEILNEKGEYTGKVETREKCHKEELGIDLQKQDLTFIGSSISSNVKGDIVNNHFNEYYIANADIDETTLILQTEEVSDVKWMDKEEIIQKIKDNYNGITDKEGCWDYLVKYYEWIEKN